MDRKILLRLRGAAAMIMMCAVLCGAALADGTLIPVGEAVGIRVTVDGVLVAGMSEVETEAGSISPAYEAGVRAGDVIISVNGRQVDSAAGLAGLVASLDREEAELEIVRNGRTLTFSVAPVCPKGGAPRLGLWLRDGVTGIGTVTYIDPETGAFGALGHGVNDADTGTLLPIEDGSVCRAQIVDVKRGQAGMPGELSGSLDTAGTLGRIERNTDSGVFGTAGSVWRCLHEAVPVAEPSEVMSGPATILACVSGSAPREYAVEIARTGLLRSDGRDLTVRVTDPELLAATGGIVQGMSGSPILQNGKLVGAVTHVLVGSPDRGYGILIGHMLEAAKAA